MNTALPYKEVKTRSPYQERVLFFDPSGILEHLKINHYSRNPAITIDQLFAIREDGICACGCGQKLSGRRTRWATGECSKFAIDVWAILTGRTVIIQRYLRFYYGWACQSCGCNDKGHDMGRNGNVAWIKVDHILPVKHGGGGWWLSNYQLLCHDCHVQKTKKDFGWCGKNQNRFILPK